MKKKNISKELKELIPVEEIEKVNIKSVSDFLRYIYVISKVKNMKDKGASDEEISTSLKNEGIDIDTAIIKQVKDEIYIPLAFLSNKLVFLPILKGVSEKAEQIEKIIEERVKKYYEIETTQYDEMIKENLKYKIISELSMLYKSFISFFESFIKFETAESRRAIYISGFIDSLKSLLESIFPFIEETKRKEALSAIEKKVNEIVKREKQ